MTLANIKNLFPYNPLLAYHKDLGYAIPFTTVDELPEIVRNAEITHFAAFDNENSRFNPDIVIYCK